MKEHLQEGLQPAHATRFGAMENDFRTLGRYTSSGSDGSLTEDEQLAVAAAAASADNTQEAVGGGSHSHQRSLSSPSKAHHNSMSSSLSSLDRSSPVSVLSAREGSPPAGDGVAVVGRGGPSSLPSLSASSPSEDEARPPRSWDTPSYAEVEDEVRNKAT